jgi:predicted amidohydrolase
VPHLQFPAGTADLTIGSMRDIRSAAAQFEHKNADRDYNFSRIDALTADAVRRGAEVVSFHECSITGYTFLRRLSRDELFSLAEAVPEGPSTERLATISRRHGIPVLAGLLERAGDRVFNTYVCVSPDGFVARHRKMHAFVNPNLSSGDAFTVFDLAGCQCGILTCYDNNLVENVRITALLGAEIIFMPHVTGCLPSIQSCGTTGTATRCRCGRNSTAPRGGAGSCGGSPRGPTITASTRSSRTRSGWTTTRSATAMR